MPSKSSFSNPSTLCSGAWALQGNLISFLAWISALKPEILSFSTLFSAVSLLDTLFLFPDKGEDFSVVSVNRALSNSIDFGVLGVRLLSVFTQLGLKWLFTYQKALNCAGSTNVRKGVKFTPLRLKQ